jgi:hypothetical protein
MVMASARARDNDRPGVGMARFQFPLQLRSCKHECPDAVTGGEQLARGLRA